MLFGGNRPGFPRPPRRRHQNQADGLSLTWNDELNTISINGEGSVEEFNNAIQAIEINESSPSANAKKEIQINAF